MAAKDVLAALVAELLEVEDLAAEAGLRLQAAGQVDPATLPPALADTRAAAERLRQLLARLPDGDGPEPVGDEDWTT
jgi:hypothetical protein